MARSISRRLIARAVALIVAVGVMHAGAAAEEPFEAFLEGLRNRGMFAEANDYLERMASSSLISEQTKRRIPYEQGRTLVEAAKAERDVELRMRRLDEARRRFEQFVQEDADSALAAPARMQLGNILVERGRSLLEKSRRAGQEPEQQTLVEEARRLFAQARTVFDEAEASFLDQLQKLDKNDPSLAGARDELRRELTQARLFAAGVLYETAHSYDDGAEPRQELLTAAAEKYDELHKKYRTRLVGLIARMYQGRCYHELGEMNKALGVYNELLAQPDESPEIRQLQTRTLELAMNVWLDEKEKRYPEAIERGRRWIEAARGAEDRTPEGLAIHVHTARALADMAAELEPGKRREPQSEALKLARFAAGFPGEHRTAARDLIAALTKQDDQARPAATFADARDQGRDVLDRLQALLRASGADGGAAPAPGEPQQLRDQASELFRQALRLRDEATSIEDVNAVRYYLCFLHYSSERYQDAAVMGEFLAREYPRDAAARQAARIAMASYLQLYNQGSEAGRAFDAQRMRDVAAYIAERWAGAPEADDAWMVMIDLAVRAGDADRAIAELENIPDDSPRRGEAELKIGQGLWANYLIASRADEADRPAPAQLERLAERARETLERGLARGAAAEAPPSYTHLAATLSLAQIHVDAGQNEQAVQLLTDQRTGPLALADDPRTAPGSLRVESYKLALRAYVALQDFSAAEQMMQRLEQVIAADGDRAAEERLTRILISLARELQDQLARYRDEGKTEQLAKVSQGFETFLKNIARREQGATFHSLLWVADTFQGLAVGVGGQEGGLPDEAKNYYSQAVRTYEEVLGKCRDKTFDVGPDSILGVELRLAACRRRMGDYEPAMQLLVDVLTRKNTLLEAQQQAALTLQAWGQADDPKHLEHAISGYKKARTKSGKTVSIVWGWSELAVRVQRIEKYRDVFFDALYNQATCRLLQSRRWKQEGKAEQSSQSLTRAEREILIRHRLDPAMGGGEWPKKFDRLVRQIQQEAGAKPTGLPKLGGRAAVNTPPRQVAPMNITANARSPRNTP